MKKIFLLCGIILVAGIIYFWQANKTPLNFGEFTDAPQVSIANVIERPQDYTQKTVALEGIVSKQCEAMAMCFSFIEGNRELFVDLGVILMYGPTGKNGHKVRVEGRTVTNNQIDYQFQASAAEFF